MRIFFFIFLSHLSKVAWEKRVTHWCDGSVAGCTAHASAHELFPFKPDFLATASSLGHFVKF